MLITRREALELTDAILEEIAKDGYRYWVMFKDNRIPYSTCLYILKQFIECPGLTSINIPRDKMF